MKKENGITLVVLMITIIIISILVGITMTSGTKLIKKSKLQTLQTEMLLIKAKAETLKEKKEFETNVVLLGDEVKEGELTGWYKWNSNVLTKAGLSGIDNEKVYYVDYKIGVDSEVEVYYEEGFRDSDGTTYHTLSELKNMDILN